ncbi:MAG: 2-amino-4-hydroxy-6-hydroxymethyldihydropteridine diphosphokinase [Anaerolineae bacterium]|jgi:2-amino-4-hydroxy-6-hydroxymethyldihydropteridine diphosphokinase|nr:2-amino-4-hydroxy-6-hydroxymethyldihydropteridine diphosphokinase [Anaerolineae bacterium]
MSDQIHIQDLLLRAIIGINDEERRNRQDVLLNITLYTDMRAAGISDDIKDALNYRTLTKRVIQLVEGSRFYLVEKLATEIAHICLDDPRVEAARVQVEKPGALRFARSVGVEIYRTRAELEPRLHRSFISLGSNIDSEANLREAVRRLAQRCTLLAVSSVYETAPVGKIDQPNFLNAAALIETPLTAAQLKTEVLEAIEQELNRVRTDDKNAPRTIDLDIALFDDQVLDVGSRHIPDPDILKYPHVAVPLADLAPQVCHPETGQTLSEIAQALQSAGRLRLTEIAI